MKSEAFRVATVSYTHLDVYKRQGLHGEADCVISSLATDFEDAELGRVNRQMAVMMGKIKITNLGAMLKFIGMFSDLEAA